MWRATRTFAAVAAGLVPAPASAHAARVTIGSDLSAPATEARNDPNDIVFWPAIGPPGAAIDVPVKGQAIIMRLKGGTQQPRGGASAPTAYDLMHFVVLRPQSDGTWRTTSTSVDLRAAVIGKGADASTITTYTSVYPLCVEPGDRVGLAEVGGFDAAFPGGLPYQVFGAVPSLAMEEFRAGGQIDQNATVVRGKRISGAELLLQVVIGTGASARPTCGGTAPGGSDPGLLPEPPEAAPDTPSGRATVPRPGHVPKVRRGRVKIPVHCAAGARCAGTLELRVRGKRIGRSRYAAAAGTKRTVTVMLTRAGIRRVRHAGRLLVTARVTAGAGRSSRRFSIRI